MPIHLKLILFFFMGFVLTYVFTNGVMGFAKTLGIRNNNDIIVDNNNNNDIVIDHNDNNDTTTTSTTVTMTTMTVTMRHTI
jgi:hypothetical protein